MVHGPVIRYRLWQGISGRLVQESDIKFYDSMSYRHIDKDAICYGHVMKSSCRLYVCGAPCFAESIRRHGMIMGRYRHDLFPKYEIPYTL
jgi:hypothetical protein